LKKVLSLIVLIIFAALLTGGFLVYDRYSKNPEQIVPFPYAFQNAPQALTVEAPILIVGDRMGEYFAKFQAELSNTISVNLSKPIKIQSIAKGGYGIHRTLHQLRGITQWPQIVIYHGGSEEFSESKFHLSEINLIRENFRRYQDDRIETALILYPPLSRIAYEPIKQIQLGSAPQLEMVKEGEYLKRLETELMLFEQHLLQLAAMAKDRNSLLILTTTPINLDEMPRVTCAFTSNMDLEKELLDLEVLMKKSNNKAAYNKSSKLIKQYLGNAKLLYIHGQAAKNIRLLDEARVSLLEASAFDCSPWRATDAQNMIIRKVALNQQVLLFDFARLLERDYTYNTTFFDEIHPQNLYYDKGMEQLGMVIKSILKL
jgi:hypothetical protein